MSSAEIAIQRIVGSLLSEAGVKRKPLRIKKTDIDLAARRQSMDVMKFLFDPAPEKSDTTFINTVKAENAAASLAMGGMEYGADQEAILSRADNRRFPGSRGLRAIRDLDDFDLISKVRGGQVIILTGREIEERVNRQYAHLQTRERTEILHGALAAKLTAVTIMLNSLSDLEYTEIHREILNSRQAQAAERGTSLTAADLREIDQQAAEAHRVRTIPLETAKRRIHSIKMQAAHFYAGYLATMGHFVNDVGAFQQAETEDEVVKNLLTIGNGRGYGTYYTQLQAMGRGSPLLSPGSRQAVYRGTQVDPLASRGDTPLLVSINAQTNRLLGMQGLGSARAEKGKGLTGSDVEKGKIDRSIRDLDLIWDVTAMISLAKAAAKRVKGPRVMTAAEAERAARVLSGEEAALLTGRVAAIRRQKGKEGDKKARVTALDAMRQAEQEEKERLERLKQSGQTATAEIKVDENTEANSVERAIMSGIGGITRDLALNSTKDATSSQVKQLVSGRRYAAAAIAAFITPVSRALTSAKWCNLSGLANASPESLTSPGKIRTAAGSRPTPTEVIMADRPPMEVTGRAPGFSGLVRPASRIHEYVLEDYLFISLPSRKTERDERFGGEATVSPHDGETVGYEHSVSPSGILAGVKKVLSPPTYGIEFQNAMGAYLDYLAEALTPMVRSALKLRNEAALHEVVQIYGALGGGMGSLASEMIASIKGNPETGSYSISRPLVEYLRNSVLDPIRDVEVAAFERSSVTFEQSLNTPASEAALVQSGGRVTPAVAKAAEQSQTDIAMAGLEQLDSEIEEPQAEEEEEEPPAPPEGEDDDLDDLFPKKLSEAQIKAALLRALRRRA